MNSAAKSAEKLGLASGKAGKQLGYALHRTLSAEWLLRERDVVGLPQGLPELLDGVAGGALRDLPPVPAPLVALARRLADGLRGDAAVGSKEEFAAHLAALRSRLDVLVPLSRDLARDAPGPGPRHRAGWIRGGVRRAAQEQEGDRLGLRGREWVSRTFRRRGLAG